jgi:NADPH-dependent ferric siderophore reductase
VFGPRGKVLLAASRWQLFAGDESALPAIAEMALALPAETVVVAFVEVQDAGDEQPIPAAAHLEVSWLHRGATQSGTPDLLEQALAGLDLPGADRHAYLFAESRVVRRLRDLLGARGWRADEISAKGYWNTGRATAD